MPVADDWNIDFALKQIAHIDGVLSYDANAGTAPSAGDYVIGGTSGAVGKVLAGSDLGGTSATGTLTLTEVSGKFQDNETLRVLSSVNFDTVLNGGFKVGDTITGPTTESIDVQAIEYNWDPALPGEGYLYGDNLTAGFANNEQLDVSGGATAVALVHTGAETDNSSLFTSCLVNGTLAVPGTANTNNSEIIHFDAGSLGIQVPIRANLEDATSGASGVCQQTEGDDVTGSIRLIDSDSSGGAWGNNNTLRLTSVVNYDAQVAGQVFSEGDVVVGSVSGATGRVLAVIDDGDSTGRLILANETGTWDAASPDLIQVDGVTIAEVENTTFTLNVGTLNLPNGSRTEQRESQGGLYDAADSLNIRREANEVYSYIMDTFDELGELDDDEPLFGDVADQLYTILNNWVFLPKSFRFIEHGSFVDSGNNNIYRGYDSIFTGVDITSDGFLATTANPTPMPQAFPVQDGLLVSEFWLEGPFSVLLATKTSRDPAYIDGATPALGQLIDGGNVTWQARPYLRAYALFADTAGATAGVSAVPLACPDDGQNTTGTHTMAWDSGSAATLVVGEEITALTAGVLKVGIVTAQTGDAGATGTVQYVLKSGTQFADNDAVTAGVSGKTFNVDETGGFDATNDVVAGYNTDIRLMTVDIKAESTPQAVITGTFIIGEPCTQAVTGATGYILAVDTALDELYIQVVSGTFSGDNNITGDTSTASWNPGVTTQTYNSAVLVPGDVGDGSGALNYKGVIAPDITGADPQSIQNVFEWAKYATRKESTELLGGPGTGEAAVLGSIFRRLDPTYAEKPVAPIGDKPGALMFIAQGWFIVKEDLLTADIQNFSLIDDAGTPITPPNLQALLITLVAGDRAAAYRTASPGSEVIQRTEFQVGTVGAGNNQAADSTILIAAQDRAIGPVPSDVPDSGVLRVLDPNDTGTYLRFPYNAVNRSTAVFTLTSGTIGDVTGAQDLTLNDNVHVVFIEEQAAGASVSNTMQYVSDINLFIVVRRKGIRPFKTTGTFGSTGFSVGAVRNPDGVVELP